MNDDVPITAAAINDVEIEAAKAFRAGEARVQNPYWMTEWQWKIWNEAWLRARRNSQ